MESITKRKLGNPEIELLVKNAFGNQADIRAIKSMDDGWFNAVYMIIAGDMEMILKIAPPEGIKTLRYERNVMNAEVDTLKLINNFANIPIPKVLFYDNTKRLLDSEYFFMTKIAGTPYLKIKDTLSQSDRTAIEIEIGEIERKINNIKGASFGYVSRDAKKSTKWSEAFWNMFFDILLDGKDNEVKLPAEYVAISKLVSARLRVFDQVTEPHLVHWDLYDGNIMINNGKISGIIDFEKSLWGDPLMNVYFSNLYDNSGYCKGYQNEIPGSRESKCRRIIYNIYMYLVMMMECKYRKYNNEGHEQWIYHSLETELKVLDDFV